MIYVLFLGKKEQPCPCKMTYWIISQFVCKFVFIVSMLEKLPLSQHYVTSKGAVSHMFYIINSSPLLITKIRFYANIYFG